MADRGRDDDVLRRVVKKAYGLRNPSADQLWNYQHWHAVSRIGRLRTARLAQLAVEADTTRCDPAEDDPSRVYVGAGGNGAEPRPRVKERAERCSREQLANGPRCGEHVIAAAAEADFSERSLIAADERLGVRCRRGQWWLPSSGRDSESRAVFGRRCRRGKFYLTELRLSVNFKQSFTIHRDLPEWNKFLRLSGIVLLRM
jgi:hypothetical protein